jgi:hypothetical protein
VNPPRRIPTVHPSLTIFCECPSVPPWNSFTFVQTCDASCEPSRHNFPVLSFKNSEGLTLLELSYNSKS